MCRCGANLHGYERPAIPTSQADLLGLIRRKVLGLEDECVNEAALPQADLSRLSLRGLLSLVRILGRLSFINGERPNPKEYDRIVVRCAHLLSEWPKKFYIFLGEAAQLPTVGVGFAHGAFSSLYNAIFKYEGLSLSEVAFIRNVFAIFSEEHWGLQYRGRLAKDQDVGRSSVSSMELVSKHEIGRRLHVNQKVVEGLIELGEIPHQKIKVGAITYTLCDLSGVAQAEATLGRVLWCPKAAAAIGIPVTLLQILRRDGDFEARHPRKKWGFHERDVQAFIQKVEGLVRWTGEPVEAITLEHALRKVRRDRDWQVRLLRAVLSGSLANSRAIR